MQIESPANISGKSFMPLINDSKENLRDYVFSEYFHTESATIRTKDWKYIYSTGEVEDWYHPADNSQIPPVLLFNLKDDPDEFFNLSDKVEYSAIQDELLEKLVVHFRETWKYSDKVISFNTLQEEIYYYLTYFREVKHC